MKGTIMAYQQYILSEEKAESTVKKYIRDVIVFENWLNGKEISKERILSYKKYLQSYYANKSVNSIIASLNSYFEWLKCPEYKLKSIKIQKTSFMPPNKDLTKEEYELLLKTAYEQGKKRLYLIMQTICSTGIRVSELQFITAEAVRKGMTSIKCKGKSRVILLPQKLCKLLTRYITEKGIHKGHVFRTRTGKPIDRSNIWSEMKKLCKKAGVLATKVFPHNLRHLFGKTYYTMYQDISRLADILGHASINTTRIYTLESGEIHRLRIQNLGLIFDIKSKNTT